MSDRRPPGARDSNRTTQKRAPGRRAERSERPAPPIDPLATTASLSRARYRFERELGRGGMGAVDLCSDLHIGREIAYKKMLPDLSADDELVARFLREARIQGQLEHPAIVPVHDIGVGDDGAAYFSMKRVRGTTLQEVVDGLGKGEDPGGQRYGQKRLLGALVTVCLAMDFAHQRGVVHRDLKPSNIMLGDFGEVYVLDWGLAKTDSGADSSQDDAPTLADGALPSVGRAMTRPGDVLGTPGFMAPEQISGDEVHAAADVYALGAILFEVLTLEALHPQTSYPALVQSTLSGVDARPSQRRPDLQIAPELDVLCVAATAVDPSSRVITARQLARGLEAYLEGEHDARRRRGQANEHAERARDALARIVVDADAEAVSRRDALREASAAVALDPHGLLGREVLVQTLTEPFAHAPPAAAESFADEEAERARQLCRMGGYAWAALLGYLPLLMWIGITSWGPILGMFAAMLLNAGLFFHVSRLPRITERHVMFPLAGNSVTIAILSVAFGPFVIGPAVAAVNAIPFLLFVRKGRLAVVAANVMGIATPFALEGAGLLPVSYRIHNGAIELHSTALAFAPVPTTLVLIMASIGTVLVASVIVIRVMDRVAEVERQLYVYGWQLSQLLPPRVGSRLTRRTVRPLG